MGMGMDELTIDDMQQIEHPSPFPLNASYRVWVIMEARKCLQMSTIPSSGPTTTEHHWCRL